MLCYFAALMKRAICLMTLVGGALFAGCGGGGDSTPETPITPTTQAPPKLSKAEYIRQADSYCAELRQHYGLAGWSRAARRSLSGAAQPPARARHP